MWAEDVGGGFYEGGVAEQLVDTAVVEVAVVEVVAFGEALGAAGFEDLEIDGIPHKGHLLFGDERERSEPALTYGRGGRRLC